MFPTESCSDAWPEKVWILAKSRLLICWRFLHEILRTAYILPQGQLGAKVAGI